MIEKMRERKGDRENVRKREKYIDTIAILKKKL